VRKLALISEQVARGFLILVLALVGLGDEARAAWPERTITIIVPFPAGGPSDLLGRLLAAELAPKLGQNVIVENHIGAVGNIGISAGARAEPDGYTLVVVTNVVLINPGVSKVAYDRSRISRRSPISAPHPTSSSHERPRALPASPISSPGQRRIPASSITPRPASAAFRSSQSNC
jgi:hypothetical protein